MSSGSSRQNQSQSRTGPGAPIGDYYFCIEGLPRHYEWRDLKDLVRLKATHGIWADMVCATAAATRTGFARVQRYDEACSVYCFLASGGLEGRPLRIHLWDTSDERQARFLTHTCGNGPCNRAVLPIPQKASGAGPAKPKSTAQTARAPSSVSPAVQPMSYAVTRPQVNMTALPTAAPVSVESMMSNISLLPSTSQFVSPPPYSGLPAVQQQPQGATMYAVPQSIYYVSNTVGLPVNRSEGVVPTEYRGIFVGGLDYNACNKDIVQCFKRAGQIVKCDPQKDASTGRFKGNATIQYATANEAKTAVKMFDKQVFMGKRIKVRFDRDAVPLTPSPTISSASSSSRSSAATDYAVQPTRSDAQPTIVNGSGPRS